LDDKTESWDTHLPADLLPAIAHLRESFDRVHFQFGHTTEVVCFSQLHGGTGMRGYDLREYIEAIVQLKGLVPLDARRRFNDLIKRDTPPSILKAFFDFYMEGLKIQALYIFKELLEIGRANEGRLGSDSMEWAKSQTQMLIDYIDTRSKIGCGRFVMSRSTTSPKA
jgi:hypothetical protein